LLLKALREDDIIDSRRRRSAPTALAVPAAGALYSNCAAAWRSAANAGSGTLTAEARG